MKTAFEFCFQIQLAPLQLGEGDGGPHYLHARGAAQGAGGRGLHSSTFQLNLSRFWSQKPQQASTSQLNTRRFCR